MICHRFVNVDNTFLGVIAMSDKAKPCPKCNSYYPGDCATNGCKDVLECPCDGCDVVRHWMAEDMDVIDED